MDDSIRLQLFQRTLTGIAAKWYIELPQHSFVDFGSLETVFLTHFQLPICYEMGTESFNFSAIEQLHPHFWSYSWVEKAEKAY